MTMITTHIKNQPNLKEPNTRPVYNKLGQNKHSNSPAVDSSTTALSYLSFTQMLKSLTHHNKYQNSFYAFLRSLGRSYLNHKRVLVTAFILLYKKISNRVILFHINRMLLSNLIFMISLTLVLNILSPHVVHCMPSQDEGLPTTVPHAQDISKEDNGTINYPTFITKLAGLLICEPESESGVEKQVVVLLNETQVYESLRKKYTLNTIPLIDTSHYSSDIDTSHYSSDIDTSHYSAEPPSPITMPSPQKLFDDFSALTKANEDNPRYYSIFLNYVKDNIPNTYWSSSIEQIMEGKSDSLLVYLDNMDSLITLADENNILNLITLKAAITTYNLLHATQALDQTHLYEKVFINQMTDYARFYKIQ